MDLPMSFIWPTMLITLLLIPLFIGLYLWQQGRRRRLVAGYGSLGFVQTSGGQQIGLRRHISPALLLAGFALLLLASARPETVVNLPRIEGIVILAFDVSGSMAADDLDPTRLEAAKAAALTFVEQQPPSLLIGIVAFSDSGFTIQTPTNDQAAILSTLNRLSPERGTSLANGIFASINAIDTVGADQFPNIYTNLTPVPTPTPTPVPEGVYMPAVIVLLTDGENTTNPDPLEAAQVAAERGVRIHTVGIGSATGAALEIGGFTIHTQLDEAMLQQISELTDGTYYNAENEEELQAIYENLNPQLAIRPEKMEVTSIFAGASILVLLMGGTLSLLWLGRLP
jgi:Ca-activated chloride channel family protein